jgi:hypothetical protein
MIIAPGSMVLFADLPLSRPSLRLPASERGPHQPWRAHRVRRLLGLPPLGPGHHRVDVAAAAPGADEPLAPLGNGRLGTVPLRHLGSVGLDLAGRRGPQRVVRRHPDVVRRSSVSLPLFADGACHTGMRLGGWISFELPDTFAES